MNVDLFGEEGTPNFQFFEALTEFATLVFFDRRGTGVSDGAPNTVAPTLEDWAEDALAVLDGLGVERVSLLAHGLGAPPALSFAAAHPSRVSALVITQGFARLTSTEGYDVGTSERAVDRLVASVAESWGEGSVFSGVDPHLLDDQEHKDRVGRSERATFGRGAAVRTCRTWLSHDVRDIVSSVHAPVLLLQGTSQPSPNRTGAVARRASQRRSTHRMRQRALQLVVLRWLSRT